MVEVRAMCCFYVVSKGCFFFLFGKALQHPGHVAADVAHGLHPFQIFAHFVRRHAMDHVPICRGNDRHAGNAEIFLNDIDSGRGTAAAGRCNRCARFTGKDRVELAYSRRIEDAIQERQDLSTRVGKIDRRPEDEAISFLRLFQEAVDGIIIVILKDTALTLAFITADAVADRPGP